MNLWSRSSTTRRTTTPTSMNAIFDTKSSGNDASSLSQKYVIRENQKNKSGGGTTTTTKSVGDTFWTNNKNQKTTSNIGKSYNNIYMMPTSKPMVPCKVPGTSIPQFVDVETALYRRRVIFISQFIDDEYANEIICTMLYLRKENPRKKIRLYMNIPGASLRPALAIYDLILYLRQQCDIETINIGLCVGLGSMLVGAGTPGMRGCLPNSRFVLQRTGIDYNQNYIIRGQARDIALEVGNIKKWNDHMEYELSKMTGQTIEQIQTDLKRDFYLSSDEAVRYGLIDGVALPYPAKRATKQREDTALGAFEGDDTAKYQGNAGKPPPPPQYPQQQPQPPPPGRRDDDGPEIAKG